MAFYKFLPGFYKPFKNGWAQGAPWVEEQQTRDKTVLTITKALTKKRQIVLLEETNYRETTKKKFPVLRPVPPLSRWTGAPTFEFVPAPLVTTAISLRDLRCVKTSHTTTVGRCSIAYQLHAVVTYLKHVKLWSKYDARKCNRCLISAVSATQLEQSKYWSINQSITIFVRIKVDQRAGQLSCRT